MPASWYQSKVFRIAIVVLALLLLALLLVPYLLDVDRYRPTLVELLEKETDRDIEIEKIRLHLLPRLRVVVSNLQLKNPRGFPSGDTLTVERIDVGLAFWPLLRRQAEVQSVTVGGVHLNLLANERGQTNYASLMKLPQRSGAKKTEEAAPVSLTRVDALALEQVSVSSGTFWRREKRVYPVWSVRGINLEARGFDFSDPKWLDKLQAEVDLSAIQVSTPGLKEPLRFADGELEIKENTAAGDFTLTLGPLRAHGSVKVADLRKPVADFTLAMKEFDLSKVSALVGEGGRSGPKPPSGPRGRARLLARGTVQADRVIVPPLSAQKVQGKVRLYTTRLEVNPFTLLAYGGHAQGSLGVDLTGKSMPARATLKIEGVNVAQAVAAASPGAKGTITGTLEAEGRFGIPLGAEDLMAAVSGEGTFAVRDGTFPGLNVEGKLAKMAKFMQMSVPTGDTHFRSFGGDFRISNQRVHSRKLVLDAEALAATLHGSLGFDQTLDYSGSGVLKGDGTVQQEEQRRRGPLGGLRRVFGRVVQQTMRISRMRVPFIVRGTFQEPKFIVAGPPTPIS